MAKRDTGAAAPIAPGRRPSRAPRTPLLAPLRGRSDEREYLYELIQTIGAGPDLDTILRGVAGRVTEATGCHACFVYFLRDDRLLLRAATPMYAHLEGQVSMPLGEGLTGWVAKTRRSAFIKDRAMEDPRVRRAAFPQLGDDVYQSLVSVPVFARSGDVLGVITLHAEAPHEFDRRDLDFLEHTAALIGGAVENARLYEDASARVEMLSALSALSQRVAAASSAEGVASEVVRGVVEVLGASRCDLSLLAPDGRPVTVAAHPPVSDGGGSGEPDRSEPDRSESVRCELVVGEETLGALTATLPSADVDAGTALRSIAAHTAVAIRQHQLIGRLQEENLLKDFFRELASEGPVEIPEELGARLGHDLEAPHVAVHIIPWAPPGRRGGAARPSSRSSWRNLADRVETELASRFPGALVDRVERSVRAVIPVEERTDALGELRGADWGRRGEPSSLAIGVSDTASGVSALRRALGEAAHAAEVGALVRGGPGVSSYEDLGPYKYLLETDAGIRDRFQEGLEQLVVYDARRGTRLVDTLESYLDHRGNVVRTARALYIHPNTLRQRLDRIRRITALDPEDDNWLSLAVATKVVKLRAMRARAGARAEAGAERRQDG